MIVRMKPRGRNLHSTSGGEPQSPPKAHSAEAQSRREEHLRLTGILAGDEECGIDFDLRPKPPEHAVLESRVGEQLPPQRGRVTAGQVRPQRGLYIEFPPPFTESDCRRKDRIAHCV